MEERWKQSGDSDVPNYEVSDFGRIRNPKTGRILKTFTDDKGYERVSLVGKDKTYLKKVHTVVAKTFVEGYKTGLCVVHKDTNKLNNRADNLTYKTRSEIVKQTYLDGREQSGRMRPVRCVETGEEWRSIIECSRKTGLNRNSISKCANNPATKVKDGRHFEPIE